MEEFFAGITLGCLIGGFAALLSYDAAKDTMRNQAIAAQVACWKVDNTGQKSFSWNCK